MAPLKLVYIGRLAREKGSNEVLQDSGSPRARHGRPVRRGGKRSGGAGLRNSRKRSGLASQVAFVGPVSGEDKFACSATRMFWRFRATARACRTRCSRDAREHAHCPSTTRVGALRVVVDGGLCSRRHVSSSAYGRPLAVARKRQNIRVASMRNLVSPDTGPTNATCLQARFSSVNLRNPASSGPLPPRRTGSRAAQCASLESCRTS